MKVDPNIVSDEILIRGVKYPVHYKKKIQPDVFMPPPDSADVSLLRLRYSTLDFCKLFSSRLKSNTSHIRYWGLGAFLAGCVETVNNDPEIEVKATVVCSPMDEELNYIREEDIDSITTDTPGAPMHADLRYERPFVKGAIDTDHRQYAKKLLSFLQVKEDLHHDSLVWEEGEFFF